MEDIDSRPHGDESATFVIQKMYQPTIAWVLFAILTVAAAIFIMVQGELTENAINTSGENAQSASSLDRPIPKSQITNFEECVSAGNPIAESFPEQCFTPDGQAFVNQ